MACASDGSDHRHCCSHGGVRLIDFFFDTTIIIMITIVITIIIISIILHITITNIIVRRGEIRSLTFCCQHHHYQDRNYHY